MDYDDKKAEYEENGAKAKKINKVFRIIYYVTVIPAALMLLIDIITIVVGIITMGLISFITPKGIVLLVINAFLIFFCIDAQAARKS